MCDSLGIGALPDAGEYGDEGSHTLCHVVAETGVALPTLTGLGLGSTDGVECLPEQPLQAAVGRVATLSAGKDTLAGHWELMGHITSEPFPTYPHGFSSELLDRLSAACGRGIIGNRPASGTQIIEELGPRQLKGGELIVYTSADSVLQIAAHEQVIPVEELYECCRAARRLCTGKQAVARIIARPFVGVPGRFARTERRRDFPLPPPERLLLDEMADAGIRICAIGKIGEIYAGRGITQYLHTADNSAGMQAISDAWKAGGCRLVFANLVDFDMLFGHRNDVAGYAAALGEFDTWLDGFLGTVGENDAVVVTADHGCDPSTPSTDHSREYVPFIIYGQRIRPTNLGTIAGLDFVGNVVAGLLGIEASARRAGAARLLKDGAAEGSRP